MVEGTWDQARRMEKKLPPSVERVVVGSGERMCTLEALVCALRAIWSDSGDTSHVCDMLLGMLPRKERALGVLHGGYRHDSEAGLQTADDHVRLVENASRRRRRFARVASLQRETQ